MFLRGLSLDSLLSYQKNALENIIFINMELTFIQAENTIELIDGKRADHEHCIHEQLLKQCLFYQNIS